MCGVSLGFLVRSCRSEDRVTELEGEEEEV